MIDGKNDKLYLKEYRKNIDKKWQYKLQDDKRRNYYENCLKKHIKNKKKK
jgi:hypothetical protein